MHISFLTTDGSTYYARAGSIEPNSTDYTFYDLLCDREITLNDSIDLVEVYTFHNVYPSNIEVKDITKYAEDKSDNIKSNNKEIEDKIDYMKEILGSYINHEQARETVRNWYCRFDKLKQSFDICGAFKLPEPVHTLYELEKSVDISSARRVWSDMIIQAHSKAIDMLDAEYTIAETESDQDAVDEITTVKGMLDDSIKNITEELDNISNLKDILSYWPPLLLPAPAYSSFDNE